MKNRFQNVLKFTSAVLYPAFYLFSIVSILIAGTFGEESTVNRMGAALLMAVTCEMFTYVVSGKSIGFWIVSWIMDEQDA